MYISNFLISCLIFHRLKIEIGNYGKHSMILGMFQYKVNARFEFSAFSIVSRDRFLVLTQMALELTRIF